MTAKLTVLIPCKNERKNIRPCIESIRALADEILIADSGSTDGTLDIVRQIGGCRIIEREYVHSADFKNWAIPQAAHEWILLVDADERITPELAREILQKLSAPEANIDAYWMGRDNHYLGHRIRHSGWNTDGVLRLFRRDTCLYRPRWVHAELEVSAERIGRLAGRMLHYTTWNTSEYFTKLDRYAMWGALNARDAGKGPRPLKMMLTAPLRFFQLYILRAGFLDGLPGFQVCMFAAFYSFLKEVKLWEMHYGIQQPDPEAELEAVDNLPATHSQAA